MTVDKVLHNGLYEFFSLNALSKRYLGYDYDSTQLNLFEERISKKLRMSFLKIKDEPITKAQLTYAMYDVIIPYKLYLMFKSKINNCIKLELDYLIPCAIMEYEGVELDAKQ